MLERETFTRLLVKGLAGRGLGPAAEAYRRCWSVGCRVLGERKKIIEGQVGFVFATPDPFDSERFERSG